MAYANASRRRGFPLRGCRKTTPYHVSREIDGSLPITAMFQEVNRFRRKLRTLVQNKTVTNTAAGEKAQACRGRERERVTRSSFRFSETMKPGVDLIQVLGHITSNLRLRQDHGYVSLSLSRCRISETDFFYGNQTPQDGIVVCSLLEPIDKRLRGNSLPPKAIAVCKQHLVSFNNLRKVN